MYETLIKMAKENKISELSLYNLNLSKTQINEISNIIVNNTELESIDLGSNNLTDDDIIILINAMKSNNKLKEVILRGICFWSMSSDVLVFLYNWNDLS